MYGGIMYTLGIILAVIDIIICGILILLVVMQEGQDSGMGALTGATMDTFYSKQGGVRTKDKLLKRLTLILTIIFVLLTIVLYAITSHIFK